MNKLIASEALDAQHRARCLEGRGGNSPLSWRMIGQLWARLVGLFVVSAVLQSAYAATNSLQSISYSSLAGDQVQVSLKFANPPASPLAFTIDNPARIAFDFADTSNALRQRSTDIGIGVARSVSAAEASGRTRVVVNLAELVSYETQIIGNEMVVTLGGGTGAAVSAAPANYSTANNSTGSYAKGITNIDFRRGESGEGRVIINLSDPSIPVDIREQGGKIVVDFMNAALPPQLEQRLDVLDFATPVKTIETFSRGGNVKMLITASGDYEHLAYQSNDVFTVEVKEIPKEVVEERKKQQFTGERLSFNFQDIEVRSLLQLIADFTGLNVVVSDSVSGNLTIRLKNVPWDQALDIILRTKGLAQRQNGNVILVAPADEIAAREKQELEALQQVQELAPLRSEFVQINYAKSSELAELIGSGENSLLSERGNISIDERTNTLLVQDTVEKLAEIRALVTRLDVPIRQVLIESRIVIANNDFGKELGVRFGATGVARDGDTTGVTTGSGFGTDAMVNAPGGSTIPIFGDRLNVDMPVIGAAGSIGLAMLGSDYLLDLELSALQAESRGEIISSPRVVTGNQKKALIEQGEEIPYLEASSSGATSVSFKKAVLSLEVTPQITPDDNIIMDLIVKQDSRGIETEGIPSINTREVDTQVLVENGQTVVLGGIQEEQRVDEVDKVPFLGDLPVVGNLFKQSLKTDNKRELLIFVTPKILDQQNLSIYSK